MEPTSDGQAAKAKRKGKKKELTTDGNSEAVATPAQAESAPNGEPEKKRVCLLELGG
jgi:hypothetical protein